MVAKLLSVKLSSNNLLEIWIKWIISFPMLSPRLQFYLILGNFNNYAKIRLIQSNKSSSNCIAFGAKASNN